MIIMELWDNGYIMYVSPGQKHCHVSAFFNSQHQLDS